MQGHFDAKFMLEVSTGHTSETLFLYLYCRHQQFRVAKCNKAIYLLNNVKFCIHTHSDY